MSNMSAPIRPGPCMSATRAARCSATRSRACSIFSGREATREYYVNDAGGQVDVLARSAFLRYREALGEDIGPIPEGLYPGDYLKPVGDVSRARIRRGAREQARGGMAAARAQARHRGDDGDDPRRSRRAQHFARGVRFRAGADRRRRRRGPGREHDRMAAGEGPRLPGPPGAPQGRAAADDWEDREQTLFRSTGFGDDVDRPLIKSDGGYTYFASDIAYHKTKIDRGFSDPGRRLGRRPRRLCQADAGGGRGAVGRRRRSSTSGFASSCA